MFKEEEARKALFATEVLADEDDEVFNRPGEREEHGDEDEDEAKQIRYAEVDLKCI